MRKNMKLCFIVNGTETFVDCDSFKNDMKNCGANISFSHGTQKLNMVEVINYICVKHSICDASIKVEFVDHHRAMIDSIMNKHSEPIICSSLTMTNIDIVDHQMNAYGDSIQHKLIIKYNNLYTVERK